MDDLALVLGRVDIAVYLKFTLASFGLASVYGRLELRLFLRRGWLGGRRLFWRLRFRLRPLLSGRYCCGLYNVLLAL